MENLFGKRVAICGRLTSEKRRVVVARLEMQGGFHVERITPRTDIVVLPYGFDTGEKPKLLLDAEALVQQGQQLRIMEEAEFLSLLGN